MLEQQNKRIFHTNTFSIEELGDKKYIIPPYQRPYVWDTFEINKLIKDCWTAFTNNKESPYFIGTIQTSEKNGYEEVIDGQQRFITLWIIALAFKILRINADLIKFLTIKEEEEEESYLRLEFPIRKQLQEFLTLIEQDEEIAKQKYPTERVKDEEYLFYVEKAVRTIKQQIEQLLEEPYNLQEFGNYIYRKVLFVKNIAPPKFDLNKLFTTINNSGIQLEQTDILKSNLLQHIQNEEKLKYSRIWEACEHMNNYFERNVKKLFPQSDWEKIEFNDLAQFNSDRFRFRSLDHEDNSSNSFSIDQIIQKNKINYENEHNSLKTDFEDAYDDNQVVYCDPIISFGQLLLHTYRIFLLKNKFEDIEQEFHTKNLLSIFSSIEQSDNKSNLIKEFIKLLWEVRFYFDKYIVKWLENEDKEKRLQLTHKPSKSNENFTRTPKEKDYLSMLQSVLYFTSNPNTQMWLTPFLLNLIDTKDNDPINYLEFTDNELSLSQLTEKGTTWRLMKGEKIENQNKFNFVEYLRKSMGTSFQHYWFQKLEYVLWKNWEHPDDDKYKKYRVTSKNSVEHIFPQNHEHGIKIQTRGQTIDFLNKFGNLALLNVGQNSSYRNQDIKKKVVDFNHKEEYDSLKLAKIFNNEPIEWTGEDIQKHEDEMIDLLDKHYSKDIHL